jgi:hypothetical protein
MVTVALLPQSLGMQIVPGHRTITFVEQNSPPTLAEIHFRLVRAVEAATGLWAGHWNDVIGPLRRADGGQWVVGDLAGTDDEKRIVHVIADFMHIYRPHVV